MPERSKSASGDRDRGRKATRGKSPGGKHRSKSRADSDGSRSRSRSKSRGGSRSRSPGKAKKGKKDKKDKKKKKKKGKVADADKPPSEWSREMLIDRVKLFTKFETNRNTGSGSLSMQNQRVLGESLEIVMEIFRRFPEIQHITFKKCFVTDDVLVELLESMQGMQHVKTLALPFNALTPVATELICRTFGMKKKQLEVLDLRENQLEEADGHMLYRTFKQSILMMNGVTVKPLLKDIHMRELDLRASQLKQPEMAILCGVMKEALHLRDIHMSNNYFDASCALCLAKTIPFAKGLRSIDLGNNPLTNRGKDDSGAEALVEVVCRLDQITRCNIRNCGIDDTICDKVERSASVNRAVHATKPMINSYFTDFIKSRINTGKLSEQPENHWLHFDPPFKTDLEFTRMEKLNEMQVKMRPNEIILHRKKNGPHGIGMKF